MTEFITSGTREGSRTRTRTRRAGRERKSAGRARLGGRAARRLLALTNYGAIVRRGGGEPYERDTSGG